jgi:hypothetical protein
MNILHPNQRKLLETALPAYNPASSGDLCIIDLICRVLKNGGYSDSDKHTLNEIRKLNNFGIFDRNISDDELTNRVHMLMEFNKTKKYDIT